MSINQPDASIVDRWHPALPSERLGAEPISVQVLGVKIALFRIKGEAVAFRDLCIHRGVPLSLGRVEGDRVVCPYHGWSYDACGSCVRIPAQPKGKAIPEKARVTTYRTVEQEGLIWISFGQPIGPPLSLPAFDGFRRVLCAPYEVQAAAPRVIENFLDVSHLMFVHEGLLGDPGSAEIHEYRVHRTEEGLVSDEIEVYQPDADGTGKGVTNRYVYKVLGPFTAFLEKRDSADPDHVFGLLFAVLPHAEKRSTAYAIIYRNYALDTPDHVFAEFQDKLIEQDRVIVESQTPELLPLDLQAELHLVSDRASIAYRQWLKELGVSFGAE